MFKNVYGDLGLRGKPMLVHKTRKETKETIYRFIAYQLENYAIFEDL